ncbi:hypothetical protein D3C76_1145760 [compost metagenome]
MKQLEEELAIQLFGKIGRNMIVTKISYLPSFTVEEDIRNGELCKIETAIDNQKLIAGCAHHKNKWMSPLMELFVKLVTK